MKSLNIRVVMFFLLGIFVFLNMVSLPNYQAFNLPHRDYLPIFYTLYSFGIIFSMVALVLIFFIDFEQLKLKYWLVSCFVGIISMFTIRPISIYSVQQITLGVSMFFVCLSIPTLSKPLEEEEKIRIFTPSKSYGIPQDIVVGFLIFMVLSAIGTNPGIAGSIALIRGEVAFSTLLHSFIGATSVGIWEEVFFRMFLVYLIMKLNNYKYVPFVVMLLITSLLFTLVHFVDLIIVSGLDSVSLSDIFAVMVMSSTLFILALKRSLFAAVWLHFLFNFLRFILV
ncbi:MAG: CPBP family glutamic-type intramembrane protease [Defluviitaleaceae bacterium]|nr:CPBP family glutamic-type intramembrane protease [Defluviitaleaceae bacterium]